MLKKVFFISLGAPKEVPKCFYQICSQFNKKDRFATKCAGTAYIIRDYQENKTKN